MSRSKKEEQTEAEEQALMDSVAASLYIHHTTKQYLNTKTGRAQAARDAYESAESFVEERKRRAE